MKSIHTNPSKAIIPQDFEKSLRNFAKSVDTWSTWVYNKGIDNTKGVVDMTVRQFFKKYARYVESYEYDEEYSEREGTPNYWVYLKEGYETSFGTTSIHDTLGMISSELQWINEQEVEKICKKEE